MDQSIACTFTNGWRKFARQRSKRRRIVDGRPNIQGRSARRLYSKSVGRVKFGEDLKGKEGIEGSDLRRFGRIRSHSNAFGNRPRDDRPVGDGCDERDGQTTRCDAWSFTGGDSRATSARSASYETLRTIHIMNEERSAVERYRPEKNKRTRLIRLHR